MPEHARAAAGAVVMNEDREVLLIQRGPDAIVGAGEWGFPGGKVDAGRTILETASDELVQETGLQALDGRRLAVVSEDLFWGPDNHFVTSYVLVTRFTGTARVAEPHKHTAVRWMRIDHVEEAVRNGTMPTFGPLRAFVEQKGFDEVRETVAEAGPWPFLAGMFLTMTSLLCAVSLSVTTDIGFPMIVCYLLMAVGGTMMMLGNLPGTPRRSS